MNATLSKRGKFSLMKLVFRCFFSNLNTASVFRLTLPFPLSHQGGATRHAEDRKPQLGRLMRRVMPQRIERPRPAAFLGAAAEVVQALQTLRF